MPPQAVNPLRQVHTPLTHSSLAPQEMHAWPLTPQALASGISLAVVAALLAGVYPAWRASRIELGTALRED